MWSCPLSKSPKGSPVIGCAPPGSSDCHRCPNFHVGTPNYPTSPFHHTASSLPQLTPSAMDPDETTSSATENKVTWQVAFFALAPLVLNVMTQPVGSVLDEPHDHRLWMRASPIFLLAGMVYFLVKYAAGCIENRQLLYS